MKKIIINIFLFLFTFITISLLSLPILFDLIFSIIIFFILRNNFISIIILNSLILIIIFIIDGSLGKNEKHGYFYRGHEKYTTKEKNYQKNISDIIFIPHGDIYVIDSGLNKKREKIKVPRKQKFITDSHGIRNDKNTIEESEIILVGDSFITGVGTTQEDIPANALSKISGKKVASLSYGGLNPKDYEILIEKFLNIIKKDSKVFVFYFEGNDFTKLSNKSDVKKIDGERYIHWRGYKIPFISGKIRFAYERLERNKDKFLLKILSEKNYFLRNIRAKSHLIYRKFFSNLHNTGSPVKYYEIGNKTVGFLHNGDLENNKKYISYIFKNEKVLERVTAIFFVPTKLRIYSPFIDSVNYNNNYKFLYLFNSYSSLGIPVYDLSNTMSLSVSKYLIENEYLYWRDDTHWNHNGIYESMNYVNAIMKK